MNREELRRRRQYLEEGAQKIVSNMGKIHRESLRVAEVAHDAPKILDDLERQFEEKTGLTKTDAAFLFVAVALQVARQYLLTRFRTRLDDKTAADQTDGHGEEHSNRQHRYYNPKLEEIITNPVPFDANIGSNGALKGGGRLGHRVTALGHDPVLGLVVGTANIATSTLTNNRFESFHISTNDQNRDYFRCRAKTVLVFKRTIDKFLHQGMKGKAIVASSLCKEVIHLKSDLPTKNSLPLPFLPYFNPELASKLAEYGVDAANVKTVIAQASMATMINWLIAMLHGMFYFGGKSKGMDRDLYEVRTRKILTYSNVIASVTNLAVVGCTKNLKLLDVGGLLVTLHRISTDQTFIREVKHQFVLGCFDKMIDGEELHLEECKWHPILDTEKGTSKDFDIGQGLPSKQST